MKYEKNVITMTLLRLGYVAHSLGNCVMTLPTETSLTPNMTVNHLEDSHEYFRSKNISRFYHNSAPILLSHSVFGKRWGKKICQLEVGVDGRNI